MIHLECLLRDYTPELRLQHPDHVDRTLTKIAADATVRDFQHHQCRQRPNTLEERDTNASILTRNTLRAFGVAITCLNYGFTPGTSDGFGHRTLPTAPSSRGCNCSEIFNITNVEKNEFWFTWSADGLRAVDILTSYFDQDWGVGVRTSLVPSLKSFDRRGWRQIRLCCSRRRVEIGQY